MIRSGRIRSAFFTRSRCDITPLPDGVGATGRARVRDQNQVHPNGLLIVLEAANLERSLFLTSELLELGKPAVVAINMIDEAQAAGVAIDTSEIEAELGCPVVAISARNGFGLVKLTAALIEMGDASVKKSEVPIPPTRPSRCQMACAGCTCAGRHNWASSLTQLSVTGQSKKQQTISPLDRFLTSPFGGLASLAAIMLLVFFMIFSICFLMIFRDDSTYSEQHAQRFCGTMHLASLHYT